MLAAQKPTRDIHMTSLSVMPTGLKYKVLVAFCLASLVPLLVGFYVASIFINPFADLTTVALTVFLMLFFSLVLALTGLLILKQSTSPIEMASQAARNIAEGRLTEEPDFKGSDEVEALSRSLKVISKNARELLDTVERLSLKDNLTGLYNASYIRERLDEEIQRATQFQSPCSFAYFSLVGLETGPKRGRADADSVLKSVAAIFGKHISQLDRAARLNQNDFAIIFTGRNKKKAIECAERIRGEIMAMPYAKSAAAPVPLCVGISENPLDGVSADMLFIKAQERMKALKAKGISAIEAF